MCRFSFQIATFYSKMLEHDYTTKEVFNANFFKDWRSFMTEEERRTITHLKKCNFTKMATYFKVDICIFLFTFSVI